LKHSKFSYKQFAKQGFVQQANSHLLDLIDIRPGQKIVDLGCGTGAVTQLILEKLNGSRDSLVIGIDTSAEALNEAKKHVKYSQNLEPQFILSPVEQLCEILKKQVDIIVFCNGIHLVSDKTDLFSKISSSLKSGGVFALNTTFFQGAPPPETEQFYRRWMMKALRILKRRYDIRPKNEKVEARRQLTSMQFDELLCNHGFSIGSKSVFSVPFTLQGYLAISEYEDFIQGTLPGVPLEKGREALQEGVRQAFQELNIEDSVLRNWLSIVAVRS
jgi:ubiquinone/menaquinone biosynthesis C-methylase UbiE